MSDFLGLVVSTHEDDLAPIGEEDEEPHRIVRVIPRAIHLAAEMTPHQIFVAEDEIGDALTWAAGFLARLAHVVEQEIWAELRTKHDDRKGCCYLSTFGMGRPRGGVWNDPKRSPIELCAVLPTEAARWFDRELRRAAIEQARHDARTTSEIRVEHEREHLDFLAERLPRMESGTGPYRLAMADVEHLAAIAAARATELDTATGPGSQSRTTPDPRSAAGDEPDGR